LRDQCFKNRWLKNTRFDKKKPGMDKIALKCDGMKRIPAMTYRDFNDRW
jgi:hypothetical protein